MIRRSLRGIDFYKNVPSEYKEGTVAGAIISFISITCLIVLSLSAISSYMTPTKINDLIIDEKHVEDKLKYSVYHAESISTLSSQKCLVPCSHWTSKTISGSMPPISKSR